MGIDVEEIKTLVRINLPYIRSVKELAMKIGISAETLRQGFPADST